jgi:hypothetical protein
MADSGKYVLFDLPSGSRPTDSDFLVRLGYEVKVCNGPGEGACPLVAGEGCPLAENARGVVFELDIDNPKHRAIVRRYKNALRDDMPIRVVVKPGQEHEYADLLRGVRVWTHEPVAGDLDALASEVQAADSL